MDFITDLPPSNGYNSIMVMVDHGSSKGVILAPCHKTISAMETADILLHYLFKIFGLPDKAISDRGPQFASHAFQELRQLLSIKLAMSTAHHPQTNGATKQSNQEIEAYLSIFCGNNPDTWTSFLLTLEFAYSSKMHANQKYSPFYLQLGYQPIAIPLMFKLTNIPSTEK